MLGVPQIALAPSGMNFLCTTPSGTLPSPYEAIRYYHTYFRTAKEEISI